MQHLEFPRFEEVLQDVRYGTRLLRRSPGFAAVAVCATSIAIGINAGFFTLVDSLVWRPIPVADASSFVKLEAVLANRGTSRRFSYIDYLTIAGRSQTLRDVTAFAPGQVALADPSRGRRALAVGAGFVPGNYFTVLGGTAQRGRLLVESDDRRDAAPAVVISDHLWRTAFASAPEVVGRSVSIDGASVTIAGVAAPDFIGVTPVVPDVWIPITLASRLGAVGALGTTSNRFLFLHGHLRAGSTRDRAGGEISALVPEPPPPTGSVAEATWVSGVRVVPQSSLVPLDAQTAKIALPGFVAVGLVLVIACANLGVLLLARALARQREVCVRMALGASRARLLRQLVTESLVIATLGAVVGLVFADWAITASARTLVHSLPISIGTLVVDLHPSARVYLYAAALAVVSALVFGLVPALHGTAMDLNASLKGEDRLFGSRLRRSRFRDTLVAGQVAACVVLAVAAAILVRSLRDSLRTEATLDVTRVRVATLGLDRATRGSPGLARARDELARRVRDLPGVAGSARASAVPYSGAWDRLHVGGARSAPLHPLLYNIVTPGYFDVVGQRMVRGRDFTTSDAAAAVRAAVVTPAAARTLWPRQDPIGQTLYAVRARRSAPDSVTAYEVVGVAADARSGSLWSDDSGGYIYLLASPGEMSAAEMPILVREDASARGLDAALANLAAEIDPATPFQTMALTTLLDAQVVPFRYGAAIATAVGALGLALAAIGLYAVVAFAVSQRRREIAVRVAMGATPRDVLAAVLRRELRLIAVGLGVGTLMSIGEAGLLDATGIPFSSLGISVFAAIPMALLAVALAATIFPARLALRVEPMQVLRQE